MQSIFRGAATIRPLKRKRPSEWPPLPKLFNRQIVSTRASENAGLYEIAGREREIPIVVLAEYNLWQQDGGSDPCLYRHSLCAESAVRRSQQAITLPLVPRAHRIRGCSRRHRRNTGEPKPAHMSFVRRLVNVGNCHFRAQ